MREIQAIVHPVVILNVLKEISELDQKKKTKKKFGCLLGFFKDNKINCTSDFILPFDEKSSNIIFFDQIFMEKMACMLKKINNKEKIVGWYNLGEKINQKQKSIIVHVCICVHTHVRTDIELLKRTKTVSDIYIYVCILDTHVYIYIYIYICIHSFQIY
jgi:hypothetical protein